MKIGRWGHKEYSSRSQKRQENRFSPGALEGGQPEPPAQGNPLLSDLQTRTPGLCNLSQQPQDQYCPRPFEFCPEYAHMTGSGLACLAPGSILTCCGPGLGPEPCWLVLGFPPPQRASDWFLAWRRWWEMGRREYPEFLPLPLPRAAPPQWLCLLCMALRSWWLHVCPLSLQPQRQ